jgi:hypothetical protein
MGKSTTIQATSKRWKLLQAVGSLAAIGGAVGMFAPEPQMKVLAGLVAFLGVCVFMLGRIGAWWFHG